MMDWLKDIWDKICKVKDIFKKKTPAAPQGPVDQLPEGFDWNDVEWVCGDEPVGAWKITLELIHQAMNRGRVSWVYLNGVSPVSLGWAETGRISQNPNACLGWVASIGGKWYGAIGEWLPDGIAWQSTKSFQSDRGDEDDHDYKFNGDLETYKPAHGQEFYMFVCGLNWCNLKNVKERSNLVLITYP